MVLQTEHYPGAYQQQSYSMYQVTDGRIPDGHYSNFSSMNTAPTAQYSTYPQKPVFPYGTAASKDPGGGPGNNTYAEIRSTGGGLVAPEMPNTGGYGHLYKHLVGSTMQHEQSSYGSGTNYSHNKSYWTQKNLDAE